MQLEIDDRMQPGEDYLYSVDLTLRDYVQILVALQLWKDSGGNEGIDDYDEYFIEAWPMTPDEVVSLQARLSPTRPAQRSN